METRSRPLTVTEALGLFMAEAAATRDAPCVRWRVDLARAQDLARELGPCDLRSIAAGDVAAYLEGKARAGELAPSSYRNIRGLLARFAAWAIANGYLAADPFAALQRSPDWWPLPSVMSESDERAVLAAFDTDPAGGALVRFLLATGCRHHEALTLRWADVGAGDASAKLTPRPPATPHRVRLSASARLVIAGQRASAASGAVFVFVGAAGGAWSANTFSRRFRDRMRAAALPWLIEDLRTAHVARRIERGESLHDIAERLNVSWSFFLNRFGAVRRAALNVPVRASRNVAVGE